MSISTSVKFAIQRFLRGFGWEIRRFTLDEMHQFNTFLALNKVETVLDVGANIGQFATTLRQAGYKGRILSFEPQSAAHAELVRAAANDPLWDVAPRCAVGAAPGEIEMNISQNSVSSSALPILEQHTGSAPASRYVDKEKASVIRLDDCDLFPRDRPTFLKIDTQGFEYEVLKGAPELLKSLVGVQMEASLAPLYEGQPDLLALIEHMRTAGYGIWTINQEFTDRETWRLLQANLLFFRSEA
ncbi:MAG: FkbM family methyltransferase [Methylocystis sp.]|nr:MAG: FkbM family methyltransferase [Methylocystis sp.]